MKKLSYQTLKELNYDGYLLESAPERVLQFGEGNFLRAFVDYFIDKMNEMAGFNSKVVVCQPQRSPLADIINEQEGLYTLFLRGFQDGQKINKKRVISCELIDNNGQELKKCVLQYARQWQLGEEFINWVQKENIFRSSLVDRISEKRGFSDLRRTGIRRSADRCRRSLRFLGNRGSAVHQRGIPV